MNNNRETIEATNRLLRDHLQERDIYASDAPWTVDESPSNGRGIFATRRIRAGEIIFKDKPIVFGPRFATDPPHAVCVVCHDECVAPCPNGCGLSMCDACNDSENKEKHAAECELVRRWRGNASAAPNADETNLLTRCLCAVRGLTLRDDDMRLLRMLTAHHDEQRHAVELHAIKGKLRYAVTDDDERRLRLTCAVLDANAFEVPLKRKLSMRGLYPLGALANHDCAPNAMHLFDERQTMIFKATVDVERDGEIRACYTRPLWGTSTRRHHLAATKHFECGCARCRDATERGSHLNSFRCQRCADGRCVSTEPLRTVADWRCIACGKRVEARRIGVIMSVLGARLKRFEEVDVQAKLAFLDDALPALVPATNQIVVRIKYGLVWTLGYAAGYRWRELSDELLARKRQFCSDILSLVDTLGLGLCVIKGLMLNELGFCLRELIARKQSRNDGETHERDTITTDGEGVDGSVQELERLMNETFLEARGILSGDVGTHAEVLVYP